MGESSGGVTISHCGRTVAADVVAFDIAWDGEVPDAEGALWAMVVTGHEGQRVMLGHERVGGAAVEQFVEDLTTGRRESFEPDADFGDGEITARFPASMVGVAVEWPTWQALISAEGVEARMVVPVA